MFLINNVVGSSHHYHNAQCVIVCQSSVCHSTFITQCLYIVYSQCLVSCIIPTLEYEVMIHLLFTNIISFFTNLVILSFSSIIIANFTSCTHHVVYDSFSSYCVHGIYIMLLCVYVTAQFTITDRVLKLVTQMLIATTMEDKALILGEETLPLSAKDVQCSLFH